MAREGGPETVVKWTMTPARRALVRGGTGGRRALPGRRAVGSGGTGGLIPSNLLSLVLYCVILGLFITDAQETNPLIQNENNVCKYLTVITDSVAGR